MLRLIFLGMSVTFCACGGGGGGGSSAERGVRLLHAGIDLPPLEMVSSVDGSPVSPVSAFTLRSPRVGFPTENQFITVRRAMGGASLGNVSIDLSARERYSILVAGALTQGSVRLFPLADEFPSELSSSAWIRFVNGVEGSGSIEPNAASVAFDSVNFGSGGDFTMVPPGSVPVVVRSGGRVIWSDSLELEGSEIYTILVAGQMGYMALGRVYRG